MRLRDAVERLCRDYPRIFAACHRRHVREPGSGELVSEQQVNLLNHLDEVDPVGVTDLARHLGIRPPTVSLALDRLESRGYVARARDPSDGRRVHVRLTPRGAAVRDAQEVLDRECVRALLRELPPHERSAALDGLGLLADAARRLQERYVRRAAGPGGEKT